MKVTFILVPPNLSGGNRVIAIYADKLRKRGHEVDCVVPSSYLGWTEAAQARLFGRPVSPGYRHNHFDHLEVPYRVAWSQNQVCDADVVIATWWETAEYVETLPARCGRKAYFVQHHEVFDYLPVDRARATYRFDQKKIVVSGWLKDLMAEVYGDEDASLVSNSVDLELFHAEPRDKQPTTTIGYMHHSAPFKNVGLALEALEIARERLPDLKVRSFGHDSPRSPQGPPEWVDYYASNPPQGELRNVYGQCDAWLFTSRVEGFGLPILEAMACRTPVIGVPEGAVVDFIEDQVSGFVVPHDAAALADAIVNVAQMSNARWRAMSEAAFERVRKQSWDHTVERFEAVLLELIADPRRAPERRRRSSITLHRPPGAPSRAARRAASWVAGRLKTGS